MKAEIRDHRSPKIEAGQLWRHKASGSVYLAAGRPGCVTLYNVANHLGTHWNTTGSGFGGVADEFEYVGVLEIKE